MIYKFLKLLAHPLKKHYKVRVLHKERLPKKGAAIYVLNHPSRSDGILTWLFLPGRPVRFFSKSSIFKMGWPIMYLAKQIPVYRGERRGHETISKGVNALRKGKIVGIFAEGKSGNAVNSPSLKKFKTGVGRLALLSGVKIYPIVIIGSYAPFTKVWALPKTKNGITYIIGKPIRFKKSDIGDSDLKQNKIVTEKIHKAVEMVLREHNAPKKYLPK